MKIIPNFQYLHTIIDDVLKGRPFRLEGVKQVSERKTGKSASDEIMAATVLAIPKRIKWIVIRQEINGSIETFDEYKELFNEMYQERLDEVAIVNNTRRTITYKNGNQLRVLGIQKNRKSGGHKSDLGVGLKNLRCDYAFLHFEERHQISNDDKNAIIEAVRGYKHLFIIQSSNPWDIANDFISDCHEHMAFDRATKLAGKEQFKVIDG